MSGEGELVSGACALALRDALPGDWLWMGARSQLLKAKLFALRRCKRYLGREFRHAVFDAGQGFDAAAFAALKRNADRREAGWFC